MAISSKYIVFSGTNYLHLDLGRASRVISGQEAQFVGTGGVDLVYLRPGVSLDFRGSGGGVDRVYLTGTLADYTLTTLGSALVVSRGSGASFESVTVGRGNAVESDRLVFADGSVPAFALQQAVANNSALPVPAGETSGNPSATGALNAIVKAVAYTDSVIPTVEPGATLQVIGSGGDDVVMIAPGTSVDARSLGGGADTVYFTGNWGDYTKTQQGSSFTYSRTIGGQVESVRVVAGTAGVADRLVFASGFVASSPGSHLELTRSGNDAVLRVDVDGNNDFTSPAQTITFTNGWSAGGLNEPGGIAELMNQRVLLA